MTSRLLAVVIGLLCAGTVVLAEQEEAKHEGRTVEQWIGDWDAGNFQQTQKAKKALVAIGEAAVPKLTELIRKNDRHAGHAIQTLAEMGPTARPALPTLMKLGKNKAAQDPAGWTWNMPIRAILFMNVHKMSWAADQFLPLLETVGNDEGETEQVRRIAVNGLRGMGPKSLPVLRKFVTSSSSEIRKSAANAIADHQFKSGKTKAEAWQEIIDQNPLDSNVPGYLANMKGIFNQGQLHPPSQQVKQLLRRELEKKPDPQLAWQLAEIIRNGLANTDLMWAAPTDSYRSRSHREDPDENYETLATALEMVQNNSQPDSELWKKAGISLAKLRLLQGDWKGMNAALVKLGQDPVPDERRPNLPPPPFEWKNLNQDWQPADKQMRTGTCGIEFRFVRRGHRLQGVQGVHVLVKQRPKPQRVFFSGVEVDTLFHATQPMMTEPFDSFGYRGQDRNQTRYGISNDKGVVRIEGLPNQPVLIEILVPTANFEERGHSWDLLMNTPDGVKIADRSDPRSVKDSEPPALVDLEEGRIVAYPVMFVHPQLLSNLKDWHTVDNDKFVVTWSAPKHLEVDHYQVKLSLSAPGQDAYSVARAPVIATQTVNVEDTSWRLAAEGVGKMRLVPGNYYLVDVDAVRNDVVVATLPRKRVWVPWAHRKSEPPIDVKQSSRQAFYNNIYFRTSVNGKPLEERLPNLINNSADMFETEYHRLGMAWLDLHKKKPNAAEQLLKLVQELPEGNVVRATAQSLLDTSVAGEEIPRRLKFVGPASLAEDKK